MTYYRPTTRRRLSKFSKIILALAALGVGVFFLTKLFFSFNKKLEFDQFKPINALNLVALEKPDAYPERFYYDSGIKIPYPEDGVKGIYMSAPGYKNETLHQQNINLIKQSNLNAIVLDVKDDYGTVTVDFKSGNPLIAENTYAYFDAKELLKEFEANQIYPIARIVTFKDSSIVKNHPDYGFLTQSGSVWTNPGGEAFLNPFKQEVWDYTVDIAIEAAKAGFKEIQFDYIRFAEQFSVNESSLNYDLGNYKDSTEPKEILRVKVINDFIDYATKKLKPYNVKVGVDIFGYTATIPEDTDIGQNFSEMSKRVDVVSSMIYPSHWSPGYFGTDYPDLHPYEVVKNYMIQETEILNALQNKPTTRPWLQDFTASYLPSGQYTVYTANEVLAQVKALKELGINEFLLWNAANNYNIITQY